MAGNNSIQILRIANLASTANSSQIPLDGQPFYDKATRKLFVGDGTNVLANYRNLDKGIVAGGLSAPWGSILNSAGMMRLATPTAMCLSASAININSTTSALNINSRGSLDTTSRGLNVASELEASIDIARDFDIHSGYNIDVDADNNINMNALAFNANATANANYFASLSLSNQGININANMQGNGKVDIYGSAGIRLRTGLMCNVNIGTSFEVNGSSNFRGSGTTSIGTPLFDVSSSSVNIYSSSSLDLDGGLVTLGRLDSGAVTNVYGGDVYITGYDNLWLKKSTYYYSFPDYSGTVAMRSDIGEVIYSNIGRVLPNTSTSNANAFSLINSSDIYMYDKVLIKFKCSQRPNGSSLSSYFATSVVADRMNYLDDWGSFSVTPTFITCYYGDFSIFRSHCHIQFSYTNGQILANQYQSSDSSSYSSYGMTFYANGNVATFNANSRSNFWKVGITDIIGLVKNANYINP